ncbi:MAG: sterol desaturase family protein [Planctomycetaceae bacterium]
MTNDLLRNIRMIAPILGLVLIWSLEAILHGWWSIKRVRHAIRNLGLWAINTVVLLITLSTFTVNVIQWADGRHTGLLRYVQMSGVAAVLSGIILLDLWMWLWHLLNHRVPFLWRFHRVHHSDVDVDVTTSFRFHLGEILCSAICRIPVLVVLGIGVPALLLHETLLVLMTQFHHSRLSAGRWDSLLQYLIVTPDMHRIHHSPSKDLTNSNYSSIMSVWDRIFSTFRARSQSSSEPTDLGLKEFRGDEWQTLAGMLQTPFVDAEIAPPAASESQQ